jgi:exosortase/archaeosortase family protein
VGSASLSSAHAERRRFPWLDRTTEFARQHRQAWPAVGIVIATIAAYHFTLASLFDFLWLETPLAYVPLLPIFCIAIAVITANRYANVERPMVDRQIDLIVAVPLIVVALLMITLEPVIASAYYWTDRMDVVSMALFAAAATIILYGVTWFWRLKASFFFLILMWPALYLHFMAGLLQSFTNWTNATMAQVVHHLPLGASLDANPGDVIIAQGHNEPLIISIGSACSGADTVLGFALVGGAVLTVLGGGRRRKLMWWVTGLVLTFLLNILRLTSIIALAQVGQPSFALGGYHAVIGLVLFAIAVLAMLWALPLFGLRVRGPVPEAVARSADSSVDEPSVDAHAGSAIASVAPKMTALGPLSRLRRALKRRRTLAISSVVVLTAVVAFTDQGLQPYAAFDDGSGSPTVTAFAGAASAPSSWTVLPIAQYPWVTQYFGDSSTWVRYSIADTPRGQVYADVVLTADKSTLDTYNLLNCFLFHNYDIRTTDRIDLGSGVYGLLLNYSDPQTNAKWSTVSWAWPVTHNGASYYERIALTSSPLQGQSAPGTFQPAGGVQDIFLDLLNGVSGVRNDPNAAILYRNVDTSLRAEAQALVEHAVVQAA